MTSKTEPLTRAIGADISTIFMHPLYVMLTLGILHLHVASVIPALGYWTVFWPVFFVECVIQGALTVHRAYAKADL